MFIIGTTVSSFISKSVSELPSFPFTIDKPLFKSSVYALTKFMLLFTINIFSATINLTTRSSSKQSNSMNG